MALSMVELKRMIDELQKMQSITAKKVEGFSMERLTQIESALEAVMEVVSVQSSTLTINKGTHVMGEWDLERHIPMVLLKEMVKVFDANSHKDINDINMNRVLMEMQVEAGKIAISLAKDPEEIDCDSVKAYLVDLMNYSVIMWKKVSILEDGWLNNPGERKGELWE